MPRKIRVTVWNEGRHEKRIEAVKKLYPQGMHAVIAGFLGRCEDMTVRTATLDEPRHGLSREVLDETDVMTWWGHGAHREVSDEVAADVQRRVMEGMGLIVLHSGHMSKIFRALMGTGCTLKWREAAELERLWNLRPAHPIAAGLGEYFEIPNTEMYGERFDIPEPDELVFVSWFQGGEVFRSGCVFYRGHGKIFYFRPGHESYPIYYHPDVQTVLTNAVRWAAATVRISETGPNVKPLEKIPPREIDLSHLR